MESLLKFHGRAILLVFFFLNIFFYQHILLLESIVGMLVAMILIYFFSIPGFEPVIGQNPHLIGGYTHQVDSIRSLYLFEIEVIRY